MTIKACATRFRFCSGSGTSPSRPKSTSATSPGSLSATRTITRRAVLKPAVLDRKPVQRAVGDLYTHTGKQLVHLRQARSPRVSLSPSGLSQALILAR